MPELRRVVFDPADRTRGYKLWSHGFVEPIGTAIVPEMEPEAFPDDWAISNPVVDIQVINWSVPSGYVMTDDGEIRWFGGVVDPGIHGTVPTYGLRIWRWFFMNPNGDGSGYRFAFNGTYDRWGPTAPDLPGDGVDFGMDFVRDVALDWTTKKWVILGRWGVLFASFTVATTDVPPNPLGYDAYRSLVVRSWSLSQPKILVGHMSGWLYGANTWGSFSGQPVEWQGRDVLADLVLVNDGSGADPMELAMASRSGGVYRWFVSEPPEAIWIDPDDGSTVTTTTRPTLTVGWTDPDGDLITGVDVRLYGPDAATVTDPIASAVVPRKIWLSDQRQNGFVPDFDLDNGEWQALVRVSDAANDLSAWEKTTWDQTVTRPPTPTITEALTIGNTNRIEVSGTTSATRFIFLEYSDDDGDTWFPVRDANPGPSILTTGRQMFDYEAPFQEERTYRARVASVDPDLSSLWSTEEALTVPGERWVLMRVSDHEELRLRVDPDISKPDPTGTGKFVPLEGSTNVVLTSGWSEGDLGLKIRVLTKADRRTLLGFLRSGETLLLRTPFGDHWYVQPTGDITRTPMRAVALIEEPTPLRDANIYNVTFTVVGRPAT